MGKEKELKEKEKELKVKLKTFKQDPLYSNALDALKEGDEDKFRDAVITLKSIRGDQAGINLGILIKEMGELRAEKEGK